MYDEKLVTDNVNLIYYILGKLNLYHKRDEYFDIGMIGLVKAAKNFEPDKNYLFSTYAGSCIYKELLRYIRGEKSLKRKVNNNAISLNKIIYDNGENTISLEDTLISDFNIEEEILKKEEIEDLHIALSKLKLLELKVLEYTFGLNGAEELTQQELSKKYNLSQAQISRIKNKAIKKLREELKK